MHGSIEAVRKIDGKARRISRQFSLFLLVFCVIALLWLIFLGIILYSDQKNVERYQSENYERFSKNIARFDALCADTQPHVAVFEDTQYVLPAFDQADTQAFMESLQDPSQPEAFNPGNRPFILDTMMDKMNTRLKVLALAADTFTTFAAFNASSGVGIAVAEHSSGTGVGLRRVLLRLCHLSLRREPAQALGDADADSQVVDGHDLSGHADWPWHGDAVQRVPRHTGPDDGPDEKTGSQKDGRADCGGG